MEAYLEPATTAQLVFRAKHGDREAFGALIRLYERTALAVAYAATADASSAGDATQEAFLRAWQRLAALKEDGKFATWLCRIVRNVALDLRRKSHAARQPRGDERDRVADPVMELDQRETADRVDEALWQLDDVSRTMVVLRYYEGLSSHAIADVLATTATAVDMRLSRARQRLRTTLERVRT
ncbi:MAG: polymerase sigma-70 factor, subfamily [Phycisphaerales bacterium]|jgi:RNA polymerase sigma-70 factor (ECF subfamily)|nr:polymerase sigma-70 factor, subfamily [Phycisphaerales bacterium]